MSRGAVAPAQRVGAPRSGSSPRLRLAVACAAAAGTMFTYAMRRVDPDLYGYLAYGRLFVETGGLTSHDPFAYTTTNAHWVTFEYLAHIALWIAYRLGGPIGLIALKCAVGGAALYFLYAAIRAVTDDEAVWLPVFLLSASTLSRFFLFRPQVFTFAFFAIFVAALMRFLLDRDVRLWPLPFVMLIWANTHGGYLAGIGAVGLALMLRASMNLRTEQLTVRRVMTGTGPLWMTLVACLAVTVVNPQGLRLWGYVLDEMSHGTNRRLIAEWMPPSFSGDFWSMLALIAITITLLATGWMAHRYGNLEARPRPVWWILSSVPLVAMSYVSVRHIPLAAIWAAPVITVLASAAKPALGGGPSWRRIWLPLSVPGIVATFLTFAAVSSNPRVAIAAGGTTLGSKHPCGAVAFLRANKLKGNLYTPIHWGAYLTWELYPGILVSMDGRNISLFPDAMVIENVEFYGGTAPIDVPLRYPSDFLLLASDDPVREAVRADSRWKSLYADEDALLFVRADESREQLMSGARPRGPIEPSESCPQELR